MSSSKPIDLVAYGATGFTGKLACGYLAQKDAAFQGSFRWAIAGRNQTKLDVIKQSLTSNFPQLKSVDVLVADSADVDALDRMASQCKAAINFAGPYSKFAKQLVEACVKNSTHYADLSAELFWIAEMMESLGEAAEKNRCKVVHCCGFDSVPSDWTA